MSERPPDWSSTWRDDTTGAGWTRDEAIALAAKAVRRAADLESALRLALAGDEHTARCDVIARGSYRCSCGSSARLDAARALLRAEP